MTTHSLIYRSEEFEMDQIVAAGKVYDEMATVIPSAETGKKSLWQSRL